MATLPLLLLLLLLLRTDKLEPCGLLRSRTRGISRPHCGHLGLWGSDWGVCTVSAFERAAGTGWAGDSRQIQVNVNVNVSKTNKCKIKDTSAFTTKYNAKLNT